MHGVNWMIQVTVLTLPDRWWKGQSRGRVLLYVYILSIYTAEDSPWGSNVGLTQDYQLDQLGTVAIAHMYWIIWTELKSENYDDCLCRLINSGASCISYHILLELAVQTRLFAWLSIIISTGDRIRSHGKYLHNQKKNMYITEVRTHGPKGKQTRKQRQKSIYHEGGRNS